MFGFSAAWSKLLARKRGRRNFMEREKCLGVEFAQRKYSLG
jgi:hypothetical protein